MITILVSLFLILIAAIFVRAAILVFMMSERKIIGLSKRNLTKKELERIFDPKFPY